MDPLSITASLIAVLQVSGTVISALYEYRNGVKSASADAARLITELNSLRSILESLLQAVEKEGSKASASSSSSGGGGSNSRLANFQALTQPDGELKRCLADLEAVSVKLGAGGGGGDGEEAASPSRWKKVRQALVWPFKEKDVEKLLQSVQKAKSTMQLALAADQTALTLEIHEGVSHLTEQFTASSLDQRRQRIRGWLAAPDPFLNHAAARKKRQPLTGDWFLRGKMYEVWRSAPRSFLWMYGIPGAGKSILCSSIIEDLLSRQTDHSLAVAFYYFDFNDVGRRDTTSLIRALVAQLLTKVPNDASCLEKLYSQIDDKQPDVDFLLEMVQIIILELGQVYVVIDALDECEECEELMKLIETIYSWDCDRLHILVASRQLPEIQEVISECTTSSFCLHNSINDDIHILIQERLRSDRKFQKWPYQVRQEIDEALTVGASGMFRWVVCQLDMLRNCVTLPALRKALKSLPKTLDETYERILRNVDESYVSDVRKLLQFLAFSPRAASLAELVEVLAVDMDAEEPHFDPENRIPDPNDILTMCSTLVTTADLMRRSTTDQQLERSSTVRLAHFSVKEYLLSERIKSSNASIYSMDPISGNLFIARTYLVYLLSPQFADGPCGSINFKARCRAFPLFRAAVLLFPTHLSTVDSHIDPATTHLIQALFATRTRPHGGNCAAWVEGLIPEAKPDLIAATPPLYYAASFGMASIVQLLLAHIPKSEIDVKGGRARSTPLHVACFRGQTDCVRLLLEAGADPNSTNNKGESCLFWTRTFVNAEHEAIYHLLLKYGARYNRRPPRGLVGWGMRGVAARLETSSAAGEQTRTRQDVLMDVMSAEHHEREYARLEANEVVDVEAADGTVLRIKAGELRYL